MQHNNLNVTDLVATRNSMLKREQDIYMTTVKQINMRMKELVTQELGATFVTQLSRDLCGELSRRYFDTSNYYITVDQLYDRFTNFSYDNEIDPLKGNDNIKKEILNYRDQEEVKIQLEGSCETLINGSSQLRKVNDMVEKSQKKLFTDDRSQDKLDKKGKKDYHTSMADAMGQDYDELTGEAGEVKQKGNRTVSDMHADHIQPRNGATYTARYLRKENLQALKEFYNSPDNFQMIHASANTSKGDIIICEDRQGNHIALNARDVSAYEEKHGTKLTNITYKCSAEEIADATVERWESSSAKHSKLSETLKKKGYLDKDGKVKSDVREKLVDNIKHSQNKESIIILKNVDYGKVSMDAGKIALNGIGKIVAGQVIYYAAPPVIYECKGLVQKNGMSLTKYIKDLPKSFKRIIKYVVAHLKDILNNVAKNFCNNFIKVFFDLLIEMVKATVKKLLKIAKELVMSVVNCIKTLFDSSKSAAEKGDAIMKIISVTITGIVVDIIFDSITFLPPFLVEPLQILVTVIATSGVMLILQKLDLFNVRYGLLVANIEKAFNEENEQYLAASQANYNYGFSLMDEQIEALQKDINDIQESLSVLDVYHDDVTPYLQRISQIFDMQIDFEKEWAEYVG